METLNQSAYVVSAIMGILAFLFEAVPYLKAQFNRLTPKGKQVFFAVINVAVVVGLTFYQCRITVGLTADCITADSWGAVVTFLGLNGIGFASSQGVHSGVRRMFGKSKAPRG